MIDYFARNAGAIDVGELLANPVDVLVRHVAGGLGVQLPAPEESDDVEPNPAPRRRRAVAGGAGVLMERIAEQRSGVYPIIGPRGSAKTGFALRLTEWIGRPRFSLVGPIRGVGGEYAKATRDIRVIGYEQLRHLPKGAVVIMDDATTTHGMNSRDYAAAAARNLQDLVNLSRHHSLTFVLTAQNTASLNKYLLDADAVFFKPPGRVAQVLGHVVEREQLDDVLRDVRTAFEKLPRAKWNAYVYAVSEEYVGMIHYDRPRARQ